MGVFYTIALKIQGQIKPEEVGELVEKQIKLICEQFDLKVIEDKCGFCSDGFNESRIKPPIDMGDHYNCPKCNCSYHTYNGALTCCQRLDGK